MEEQVHCRIIGLGDENRADDAIGPLVARRVAAALAERSGPIEVAECASGTSLLALWDRVPLAIVIDAMVPGAKPGAVRRFAPPDLFPVSSFVSPTHAFGLAEAIALGDVLHQLPDALVVYGIEAASFDAGAEPSSAILKVVDSVAERIVREATHACPVIRPRHETVCLDPRSIQFEEPLVSGREA